MLKARSNRSTYHGFLLLLRLRLARLRVGSACLRLFDLAVGLCLGDFARHGLAATATDALLCAALALLLVLLLRGFGDLDDDIAALEVFLVEGGDGLFGRLLGGQRDKPVAS